MSKHGTKLAVATTALLTGSGLAFTAGKAYKELNKRNKYKMHSTPSFLDEGKTLTPSFLDESETVTPSFLDEGETRVDGPSYVRVQAAIETFSKGLEYDEKEEVFYFQTRQSHGGQVIHTSLYELYRQLYLFDTHEVERGLINRLAHWMNECIERPQKAERKLNSEEHQPAQKDSAYDHFTACQQMLQNIIKSYGLQQIWTPEMEERQQVILMQLIAVIGSKPPEYTEPNDFRVHPGEKFVLLKDISDNADKPDESDEFEKPLDTQTRRRKNRLDVFAAGIHYTPEKDQYFFLTPNRLRVVHTCYYQLWRQLYMLELLPGMNTELLHFLDEWLYHSLDNPKRRCDSTLEEPRELHDGEQITFPAEHLGDCVKLMLVVSNRGLMTIWTLEMEEEQRIILDEFKTKIERGVLHPQVSIV